jgi:hypothetical protein
LDYFVVNGHTDLAVTFAQESNTPLPIGLDAISIRVAVKEAVVRGDIEEVHGMLAQSFPSLLSHNEEIQFLLHRQQVIELLKKGALPAALDYACQSLPSFGAKGSGDFAKRTEEVMTLFAFPDTATSPVAHLLEPAQRYRLGERINACILQMQNHASDARLPNLLKSMRVMHANLHKSGNLPTSGISLLGIMEQ